MPGLHARCERRQTRRSGWAGVHHQPWRPAFALLKIEDYYHLEGQQSLSLLDVMDAIPGGLAGGAGIEFEAPRLQVQLRAVKLR